MDDIISILIRAIVWLLDCIMSIFRLLCWTERKMSETSTVGESPLDQEARDWQDWVFDSWQWLALVLLLFAALVGGITWYF